jgi:hypothetical protein
VHLIAAGENFPIHTAGKRRPREMERKMKKTGAIYMVFASTLLLAVSVVMFYGIAQANAASLDGFVGVPWGADKQQVAKAMAQRDFKKVAEGASYITYRGTFADLPADLTFAFKKNGFYTGEADLLSCRDQEIIFTIAPYKGIKELLIAKYGPPDDSTNDAVTSMWGREGMLSKWSMRTTGTPPAPAGISLQQGPGRRLQTYADGFGNATRDMFRNGVLVVYSASIVSDPY